MARFIKIHDNIINIESISSVEFISDDIYLGEFPQSKDGTIIVDFIFFLFGRITLFSGQEIDMTIDLYSPEDGQSEEEWYKVNRSIINMSWNKLVEALGGITTVTDYEYQ